MGCSFQASLSQTVPDNSAMRSPQAVRLILADRGRDFCEVLRWQFRSHPEVEIFCGRFEDLPAFDCVITAGNSFGLMDAGMDLAVLRYFGTALMETIQQRILSDYLGEQPVGTCILVPTGHPAHPFVAHSPTMRIPMNISGTDNGTLPCGLPLLQYIGITKQITSRNTVPAAPWHAQAWAQVLEV